MRFEIDRLYARRELAQAYHKACGWLILQVVSVNTILRTHPDATVYLDEESAAELKSVFAADFA